MYASLVMTNIEMSLGEQLTRVPPEAVALHTPSAIWQVSIYFEVDRWRGPRNGNRLEANLVNSAQCACNILLRKILLSSMHTSQKHLIVYFKFIHVQYMYRCEYLINFRNMEGIEKLGEFQQNYDYRNT